MTEPRINQKAFVRKVIKETGCTHEQAMFVLGRSMAET